MNVLVSSAGRRGALIQLIRDTIRPQAGRVFAIDAAPWSSACRLADEWFVVPPLVAEHYCDTVMSICLRHHIRLVIPTHDMELAIYAAERDRFAERGIQIACSGPRTIAIAGDKLNTFRFLNEHQLPTVPSWLPAEAEQRTSPLPFPLVVKPRGGSGSAGIHVAQSREELAFYLQRTELPLIQSRAVGREFTVNMFVDQHARCVTAVPHWRIETRGGEVSKCMTVRDEQLIGLAERLAEALPDARGPLCFQAFIDDQGEACIIEINARLGGGYPIAHQAGANFVQMMIDSACGQLIRPLDWQDGLAMTRWDDAVFWTEKAVRQCA